MKKLLASLALVNSAHALMGVTVKNNTSHEITVLPGKTFSALNQYTKELKVSPGKNSTFAFDLYSMIPDSSSNDRCIYKDLGGNNFTMDCQANFSIQVFDSAESDAGFKKSDYAINTYIWSNNYYDERYYSSNTFSYLIGGESKFETFGESRWKQPSWITSISVTYDYQEIDGRIKLFVYEDVAGQHKLRGEYFVNELKGDVIPQPQVAQSGMLPWGGK